MKFLEKCCNFQRTGIKTMFCRTWEWWYFGMSFAGRQYMMGAERREAAVPPEDLLQFGWLCSSRCDFQWPLTLEFVFVLRRCWARTTSRDHSHFPPLPKRFINGEAEATVSTPNQHLIVNFRELQFSCVLDVSTSLGPKVSASVLHLLAGLSCAAASL